MKAEKEAKVLGEMLDEILKPARDKVCGTDKCSFIPAKSCCIDCGGTHGCSNQDDNTVFKRMRTKLKREYNFDCYGFFDYENKRCKLPMYLRSYTCVLFICNALENELGKDKFERVELLKWYLVHLRSGQWKLPEGQYKELNYQEKEEIG